MKIFFRLYEPIAHKENLVQIVIHIILNKQHYIVPTEIHIIGSVWDKEKQLVKGETALPRAFNDRLRSVKMKILAYNKQCLVLKKHPELDEINQLVFRKERTRLNLVQRVSVHLLQDELKRLEQSPLPFERLEIARDIFLFSCYTGVNFDDMSNLQASHLVFRNENWNIVYREGPRKEVTIRVGPEALAIINAWSGRSGTIVNNRLLPDISSTELRRCLREIEKLTGITKSLSQELALNTFASIETFK